MELGDGPPTAVGSRISTDLISKRFTCVTIHPGKDGTVVRFCIRQDFIFVHSGFCRLLRGEVLGEIKLEGDEFRPAKPRMLYDVTVEEAGWGGGRNGP